MEQDAGFAVSLAEAPMSTPALSFVAGIATAVAIAAGFSATHFQITHRADNQYRTTYAPPQALAPTAAVAAAPSSPSTTKPTTSGSAPTTSGSAPATISADDTLDLHAP